LRTAKTLRTISHDAFLEGILEAIHSSGAVKLAPFTRTKRIDVEGQMVDLKAVSTPKLVHASNPGRDVEKQPKN